MHEAATGLYTLSFRSSFLHILSSQQEVWFSMNNAMSIYLPTYLSIDTFERINPNYPSI